MDFGKIISLIVGLVGNSGAAGEIIKIILNLISKIPALSEAKTPEMNVQWAQRALAKLGFDPGPVDGIMGPKTGAAIAAFQKARGLVEDGWLGAETQTKLRLEAGDA